MKIKIRYFASIKEILGKNDEEIEIKEGITAGALKQKLLTMNPKITEKEQLLIAINGCSGVTVIFLPEFVVIS